MIRRAAMAEEAHSAKASEAPHVRGITHASATSRGTGRGLGADRGPALERWTLEMTLPCEDIRVIDLSKTRAGGIATMVLGDFGADVIKVEPPGGDPARAEPA